MEFAFRFWQRVDRSEPEGCWPWRATVAPGGYGTFSPKEWPAPVHRIAYELLMGPIPDGLVIDHLCRNRVCCNPAHMEAVTQRENLMRAPTSLAAINAAKTHCKRGHPFDEVNTYMYRGTRCCRACHAQRQRDRKAAA